MLHIAITTFGEHKMLWSAKLIFGFTHTLFSPGVWKLGHLLCNHQINESKQCPTLTPFSPAMTRVRAHQERLLYCLAIPFTICALQRRGDSRIHVASRSRSFLHGVNLGTREQDTRCAGVISLRSFFR